MEIKTIRASINDSITREKFWVKKIEGWKDFIKAIIHINYVTFDKFLLLSC